MADVKISQLPAAAIPLTGTEIFPLVQDSVTVQAPVSAITNVIPPNTLTYSMIQNAPANVIDYGADPTGTNDSTLAFQAAVDANANVYVPSGTYNINGSRIVAIPGAAACGVVIPSNRNIYVSPGAVLFNTNITVGSSAIFGSYNTTDVSITGGIFDGNRVNYIGPPLAQQGHGIDYRGVINGRISNVICKNNRGDGIYLGLGLNGIYCDNIQIDFVTMDNNYRNGLSIVTANNVFVSDSTFKNTNGITPEAGIDIETNDNNTICTNIKVSNSNFYNNVGSGVDVLRGHDVVVENCYFDTSKYCHILTGSSGGASAKNIKLVNNTYTNIIRSIIEFRDNVDEVLFDGNTVYPTNTAGLGIFHNGVTPTTPRNVKVFNSTFNIDGTATADVGNLLTASVADNLTNWDFSDNTVNYTGTVGSLIWRGANVNLYNNKFNIISGTVGAATTAISLQTAVSAYLDGNIFNNSTTNARQIVGSAPKKSAGPSNIFSQYFTNGNIGNGIPLTGTWTVGSIVFSNVPVSGGPIGWVCTVAGTPGTWLGFGVIL